MKKLFKLMLAGLMAVSLAACGGKTNTEKTTIEIWHTFTEDQQTTLEAIAKEYCDTHEGVEIKVTNTGSPNEFKGKVTSSVAEGVGPNIIFEYSSYARSFDGTDYLLDFEKYWGTDFDLKSLLTTEAMYKDSTTFADGKLHIVPVYTAGSVLFSNQDIYDKYEVAVPTTWDEVKTASKAIYERSGKTVVGISFDSLTEFLQLLIYQCNEGKIVDVENNVPLFNNAEVLKWVQWWAEGVKEGYFQVQAQAADGYNSGDLNNGLIASYVGSNAGMPYVDANQRGQVKNLTVTRVPMMTKGDTYGEAGIVWTRGAIGFNTGDENENKVTADFVKFFIEAKNNYEFVKVLNGNSPYKAVGDVKEYQDLVATDKALQALNGQINNSFVAPVFNAANELRTEFEKLMKGAAAKDFNATTALQTAYDNLAKAMKGE